MLWTEERFKQMVAPKAFECFINKHYLVNVNYSLAHGIGFIIIYINYPGCVCK